MDYEVFSMNKFMLGSKPRKLNPELTLAKMDRATLIANTVVPSAVLEKLPRKLPDSLVKELKKGQFIAKSPKATTLERYEEILKSLT